MTQPQQEQSLLLAFRQLDTERRATIVDYVVSSVIELGRNTPLFDPTDEGSSEPD